MGWAERPSTPEGNSGAVALWSLRGERPEEKELKRFSVAGTTWGLRGERSEEKDLKRFSAAGTSWSLRGERPEEKELKKFSRRRYYLGPARRTSETDRSSSGLVAMIGQ